MGPQRAGSPKSKEWKQPTNNRQETPHEFETRLVYITSYRTARVSQ